LGCGYAALCNLRFILGWFRKGGKGADGLNPENPPIGLIRFDPV
jgi:hypothetical protein